MNHSPTSLRSFFNRADYRRGTDDLLLCRELCARYADERPFEGIEVVIGHPLVWNSIILAEAIARGGGRPVIAHPFPSRATAVVESALHESGVAIFDVPTAAAAGDLFIDVNAVLGRARTPTFATEITRTGVMHYRNIRCPTLSADDTRTKLIEASLGMGDSFVRAWEAFRGAGTLRGAAIVEFGFGKIGRGIAIAARRAGAKVTIVELSTEAIEDARTLGFDAVACGDGQSVRRALAACDGVIAVTGIAGAVGASVAPDILLANDPVLVNMGAEDEFGPETAADNVLGGKGVPPNFHLEQPTLNRYIDPSLAAQLMAVEWFLRHGDRIPHGVTPLPDEADTLLVQRWMRHWPNEDGSVFLRPGELAA
jgi:adenosylhomocysteinase